MDKPHYKYESDKTAGAKLGTLYPSYRKVLQADIEKLRLDKLEFENNKAVLGEFSSVWHPNHSDIDWNNYKA